MCNIPTQLGVRAFGRWMDKVYMNSTFRAAVSVLPPALPATACGKDREAVLAKWSGNCPIRVRSSPASLGSPSVSAAGRPRRADRSVELASGSTARCGGEKGSISLWSSTARCWATTGRRRASKLKCRGRRRICSLYGQILQGDAARQGMGVAQTRGCPRLSSGAAGKDSKALVDIFQQHGLQGSCASIICTKSAAANSTLPKTTPSGLAGLTCGSPAACPTAGDRRNGRLRMARTGEKR